MSHVETDECVFRAETEPKGFAWQGPLMCALATFVVATCNGRNTSICAVRRLETDAARRVQMLRRKFVDRVLLAVGAA